MINKIKKVFKILSVFIISLCLSSCNNTLDNKRQDAINYVNSYANEIRLYEDIILDSNEFDVYIQHNINKLTNSQTKASIDYIVEEFNNDINNYLVCSLETALKLKQGYVDFKLKTNNTIVKITDLKIYKYIGNYDGIDVYIYNQGVDVGPITLAGRAYYTYGGYGLAFDDQDTYYFGLADTYYLGILSDETTNKLIDEYYKFWKEEGKYK